MNHIDPVQLQIRSICEELGSLNQRLTVLAAGCTAAFQDIQRRLLLLEATPPSASSTGRAENPTAPTLVGADGREL